MSAEAMALPHPVRREVIIIDGLSWVQRKCSGDLPDISPIAKRILNREQELDGAPRITILEDLGVDGYSSVSLRKGGWPKN